jgi:hypothetical protein
VIFGISGVLDITVFKADTIDPPVGTTNVSISSRQLGTIDTANIDITS